MIPARRSAGENRFPGWAKWVWVSAVHSPGLMPTQSSRTPGPIRSGTTASRKDSSSARLNPTRATVAGTGAGPAWRDDPHHFDATLHRLRDVAPPAGGAAFT